MPGPGRSSWPDAPFCAMPCRQSLQEHARVAESENLRSLRVAYQGTDGAYSQIAAEQHFAARASELVTRGYDSFAALLEAVARGDADYAMQPIENTTAGS